MLFRTLFGLVGICWGMGGCDTGLDVVLGPYHPSSPPLAIPRPPAPHNQNNKKMPKMPKIQHEGEGDTKVEDGERAGTTTTHIQTHIHMYTCI